MEKQRKQTWQAVMRNQHFLVELCCLTRLKGLCSINSRLEMKECMRCSGLLLVLANTWCLLFSTLSWVALWEWDLLDKPISDIWEKRQSHCEVTEILSVFVQGDKCTPLFSYNLHKREWTLKLKLYISLVSPLSSIPPSFTLPPPFVCEAAILFCSNEGTSKAAGMEKRGRGTEIS